MYTSAHINITQLPNVL